LNYLPTLLLVLVSLVARAQLLSELNDESKLYAQSKQVNQFFRRFNGEEDQTGKRYYPGDRQYQNVKLRKKYLGTLFDDTNAGMSGALKVQFAKDVLDKPESTILGFHNPGWFSEVRAKFKVDGREQVVTLFLELENDHLGSKWVISHLHADYLDPYFGRDTTLIGKFLHPMSHELDFMNLDKVFANRDSVSQFTINRFAPDHLSVFLYEVKKGNITFLSVEEVKFHFFQVAGWYFELAQFNRPGYNTGWLIANLVKLNDDADKEVMRKHLYHETR
jgi:hypothetical protein